MQKILNDPLPQLPEDERIYLNVPYQERNFAKITNCGFDKEKKELFMKRILSILMIAIILCTSVSCTKEDISEYTDNYLYTSMNGVLYRISPVSDSVTPVCPDPLCTHSDESCPFYGVENIQTVGQFIYYLKMNYDTFETAKLCRYDLKNGKYEELYQPDKGNLYNFYACSDYIYFNQSVLDENQNNKHYVWRYDLNEYNAEKLSDKSFDDFQNVILVKDNRVYWRGTSYYSTDLDYKNIRDNDRGYHPNLTMDKYYFELESSKIMGVEGYKQMCFRLTRVDSENGEKVIVSEEMASAPIRHNGKFIYGKVDELRYIGKTKNEESGAWEKYYDKYGGKLYICDSDGNNERVLCDFGDTNYTISVTSGIIGGKSGIGDWIAIRVFTYVCADETDPEKIMRGDNAYMLININTGEMKVAKIEKRS